MLRIYEYIKNPNIYAIFDRKKNLYIISTNPNAAKGVIVII